MIPQRPVTLTEIRRRIEIGQPVFAHDHGPVTMVDQPMVKSAQQHTVSQARLTAARPVLRMMTLTPARRTITTRKRTTLIPQHKRPPQMPAYQTPLPAQIQRNTRTIQNRWNNPRVTSQTPHSLSRQPLTRIQRASLKLVSQQVKRSRHRQLWTTAAVVGQISGSEQKLKSLNQSIMTALPSSPLILDLPTWLTAARVTFGHISQTGRR
jgi:hypothetical protein